MRIYIIPPTARSWRRTREPFLQTIQDLSVRRMAVGRIALVGDAAFIPRPVPRTACIGGKKTSPLFRTLGGRGRRQLGAKRMSRQDARRMIVRRAVQAGIITKLGCHTFRATGITVYLLNGGLLEYAQQMAAHESARTRSSTIGGTIRSHSTKSKGLFSDGWRPQA